MASAIARGPAPIDQAVDAALALPALDACADPEALLAAAPLLADAAARARIDTLRRRIANAGAMALAGRYREARMQAVALPMAFSGPTLMGAPVRIAAQKALISLRYEVRRSNFSRSWAARKLAW